MTAGFSRGFRQTWVVGLLLVGLAWAGDANASEAADRVREKCLEFLQAIGSKEVDTYVKGRPASFDRTYKVYHYLANSDKIAEMQGYANEATEPTEKHAYQLLVRWLELQTIKKASAPEVDGGSNYMAETEIIVGGEEIPLRDVERRMASEPDRSTRRQWSFAYKEFLENVNVYRRQQVHLSNEAAKKLQHTDFLTFLGAYKDFDADAAGLKAQSLIDATNDLYKQLFEAEIVATFGSSLTLDQIRFYDLPMLTSMTRFNKGLDPKKAYENLRKSFKGMGIDINDSRAGDISAKEATEPHALSGVRGYIDQPVRNMMTVAYKPTTGFVLYKGMLHEIGRMMYHGRAGGAFFEHHFFGDPTVSFAIAYLFENLLQDAAWLQANTKLEGADVDGVRQAHAFHRLLEARELAARVLFLPRIYEGIKQPQDAFEQAFEPVRMWTHTEVDRVLYMEQNDDFDCIPRLRGMVMAIALERALVENVGADWWSNKKTAQFLAEFWKEGQSARWIDFAQKVELTDWDPSLLVTDFDGLTAVVGN